MPTYTDTWRNWIGIYFELDKTYLLFIKHVGREFFLLIEFSVSTLNHVCYHKKRNNLKSLIKWQMCILISGKFDINTIDTFRCEYVVSFDVWIIFMLIELDLLLFLS